MLFFSDVSLSPALPSLSCSRFFRFFTDSPKKPPGFHPARGSSFPRFFIPRHNVARENISASFSRQTSLTFRTFLVLAFESSDPPSSRPRGSFPSLLVGRVQLRRPWPEFYRPVACHATPRHTPLSIESEREIERGRPSLRLHSATPWKTGARSKDCDYARTCCGPRNLAEFRHRARPTLGKLTDIMHAFLIARIHDL